MAPDEPVLKLSNVSAFYGRVQALHNVTFSLPAAQSLAILGPNGAGKTTLLRVISGIIVRVRGSIRLGDLECAGLPPHRLVTRGVSQVPEGKRLFGPLTVAENIDLGGYSLHRAGRKHEVREAKDLVYTLFPILRERSRQIASTLSGGEQQMLAIGRALMSRPKVLLLDEPSTGLAPKVNEALFASLAELKKFGVAILVAEQVVRLACDLADRAIVLHLGRVAMSGSPQTVRADPELKRLYLGG